MGYCVINKKNGVVEGRYKYREHANILCRNLIAYHNAPYAVTKITENSRPTDKELYWINQIEKNYNIQFTGITEESARKFLKEHINKVKFID